MASKKPKKEPMSENRREYCRGIYAVAVALHARKLDEAATTVDVLQTLLNWSNVHSEGFFDRVTRATGDVMTRREGKRVDDDTVRYFAHHMSLDILSQFVPIAAEVRGFFAYLANEQEGRDFWSDGAHAAILAAIAGLNAIRESDGPTLAGVVATDDARVAKLHASQEGRATS